jgi:hypothetical protein
MGIFSFLANMAKRGAKPVPVLRDDAQEAADFAASQLFSDFTDLSAIIDSDQPVAERLAACEKCYPLLPDITEGFLDHYGALPPSIACRDWGPELYMRLGQWDEAAAAIEKCRDGNAYHPDNGEYAQVYLDQYKKTAEWALAIISSTPGMTAAALRDQAGAGVEAEKLDHFLNLSLQIERCPDGTIKKRPA